MNTDNCREGDEQASDPDGWLAAEVPQDGKAEDNETGVESDDSSVSAAGWVESGRISHAMLMFKRLR